MSRVLVVDDQDENVYYLRSLFESEGWGVDVARNGAEALAQARKAPPTLVISDLLMPVMDGFTLLRHWKNESNLSGIPFVVYTATYTGPEDEQLAHSLGADAFILKPCEPDALLGRIAEVRVLAPRSGPRISDLPDVPEEGLLREYNEALVRKLEQKMIELEKANKKLREDIVAREQAEKALRESEARFRELAESIDDVFWLRDARSNRFLYVSPAYDALFGRPRETLFASPETWLDGAHPDDRELLRGSAAAQERGPWSLAFRIVRDDGAVRSVRARTYPVRDGQGQVVRIVGVARDVTDVVRLEDQLRHAQKMEAIGRLAGGVAHDFNNILTVILSYADVMLSDMRRDHPSRGDLEEIRNAGERASQLTRQLLAFSRRQVVQPRVLDLAKLVLGMEQMLQRLLGEDIELALLVSGVEGRVRVDPSQIEQVVMNLAVNARDAMERGGKLTLEVKDVVFDLDDTTVRSGLGRGRYVMLAITDTGTGMSSDTRERIFEPFFTTKETGKGTGLGLSTVFGIVKQNHGDIDVYSELGIGTVFKVYLPWAEGEVDSVAPARQGPATLRGSETVLLVEDDAQVREVGRTILRRHGYHVLEAGNGGEAFLVSETYGAKIHLLLTDVVMPRMSGRHLAERLAQQRPEMKVLFVSGYTEGAIVQHGILDPGIAFLQKPLTPDSLLRKVRDVLD